ncbi:MAG: hypothetical protein N6V49_02125 [Serratia symbiotica]|nr:hypothetical protein [Serratia symbiotica]
MLAHTECLAGTYLQPRLPRRYLPSTFKMKTICAKHPMQVRHQELDGQRASTKRIYSGHQKIHQQ